MTFLNQRLPTKVELGAVRIDDDDIEIVTTDGGYEVRNARHDQSLLRFEVSFPTGRFDNETIAAVKAMWKVARARLHTFRFRDFTDYQLAAEPIGTGNGSATAFQCKKSWTVDGNTHSRRITRPVSPLLVFKDDVQQLSGYSVDYATGIVTFTSAPAIGVEISVSGEFDIPVRFDSAITSTAPTGSLEHIETLLIKEDRE